jgi:predicted metalloprotease
MFSPLLLTELSNQELATEEEIYKATEKCKQSNGQKVLGRPERLVLASMQ